MKHASGDGRFHAAQTGRRQKNGSETAPVTDLDSMRQALNARYLLEVSRRVDAALGNPLLSNPGWNIMLDLFVHQTERKPITVINLCIAANAPTSTALRYVQAMLDSGTIVRAGATDENQQVLVELSGASYSAMRSILS